MSTRKKRFILGLTGGVMALGLAGVIASQNTFNIGIGVHAEDPNNVLWKHYAAVEPTTTRHGSKEFWANCSELGTHSLTKPAKGKIEEGGDFSATTYFTELTPKDDRYIVKTGKDVTFNSNGGTLVDTQTIEPGKTAIEPTTPTRVADEFHDEYTFDGWYLDGEKYDFKTAISNHIVLNAKWKRNNTKFTYSDVWTKDNFSFTNGAGLVTISSGFDNICWGLNNQKMKALYIAEFDRTDNDGWMLNFNTKTNKNNFGYISLPATDFNTLLTDGKIVKTELGGFNNNNSINLVAGGKDTNISLNEAGGQRVAWLTRTSLSFYKDTNNKIHVNFYDSVNQYAFSSPTDDIILTDDEASGKASLQLYSKTNGEGRRYWLGKLRIINDKNVYKKFSTKTINVDQGEIFTREKANASGKAPWGQWRPAVEHDIQGIGIFGTNGSGQTTLTLEKTKFSDSLAQNKGISFTLGSWNPGEYVSFVEGGNPVSLGINGGNPGPAFHTKETIEKVWHNWQVSIDKAGMHVKNVFTNENHDFTLTDNQLNGEESLVFKLGNKQSINRFYLLTNMVTYTL